MAKNSSIKMSIGAEDRFSKTLDKLEGRISRLNAPLKRFQSNASRLDAFGPRQLRRGFLGLSSAAAGTAKKFSAIIPVLSALTGAASLAGIYRLSSAWAGMGRQLGISSQLIGVAPQRLQAMGNAARLAGGSAEGMTATLQSLANTSFNARTGLDPAALAQFQSFHITAAELEHLSPDKLFERVSTSLRSLRTPLERARAAQALFGSGAQAVIPILLQSGKAWEDNLKLAERYGVMNEKGVAAAGRLATSQTRLQLAVEGFGNTLAETIEPVLSPVVTQMAEWINANRRWIATRITDYVKQLVGWFNNGGWDKIQAWANDFLKSAQSLSQELGGWKKTAMLAAGGLLALGGAPVLTALVGTLGLVLKISAGLAKIAWLGRAITGPVGLAAGIGAVVAHDVKKTGASPWDTTGGMAASQSGKMLTNRAYDPSEFYALREYGALKAEVSGDDPRAHQIASRLKQHGFGSNQIAGILANFSQESRFSTSAQNGSHAGLAQWDRARQAAFAKRYGHSLTDGSIDEQVDFFSDDLQKHKAAASALAAARSPEEAGFAIGRHYEIPGTSDDTLRPDVNARAKAAGDWARALTHGSTSPDPADGRPSSDPGTQLHTPKSWADAVARASGSGPGDGSANATPAPQRITVDINHRNAPPGTQLRVHSSSPSISTGAIRTHRAVSPDAPSL